MKLILFKGLTVDLGQYSKGLSKIDIRKKVFKRNGLVILQIKLSSRILFIDNAIKLIINWEYIKLQQLLSKQMYAINITPNNSQKCYSCQNTFIEHIGTQAWCLTCNKAIAIIQQETKVVPKMYQSNSKDKLSSTQLNIKNYLNQFCNKYGGLSDIEEINFLYHQVLELKNKKGFGTKNYRQNSAVIVYVHFKNCHRQSFKQFCKKNQVDQKSFNKSYLIYQKLMKEKKKPTTFKTIQDNQDENIKEEDLKIESTEEQFSQKEESENQRSAGLDYLKNGERLMYLCELNAPQGLNGKVQSVTRNQHFDRPNQNTTIEKVILNNYALIRQIRSFLQAVFDSFFHSLLYQQKKSVLIEQLSEQILEIYQTLKLLFQQASSSLYVSLQGSMNNDNFYKYLFYLVLRKISHGISQVKYRKLIQDSTGESIKATVLKSVIKALDVKEETASSFSGQSLFFVQNSGTTGSEFVKIQQKQ